MTKPLRFADDTEPGITRKPLRRARGVAWAYFAPDGTRITERDEIDRLNAIALPPAYSDCWFSPNPASHLLATGMDARGRKQYRYHPQFRLVRESEKFDGLAGFGEALPAVRARVEQDAARRSLSRERAIACVVRLLDAAALRIGNECYSKANRSFGATTLRRRHARMEGKAMRLRYRAKSGKLCDVSLNDRHVLRFVRQLQDLPGQRLFMFVDENGSPAPVTSGDVNAYLRETMGGDFTAKHFRTWAASVVAFEALAAGSGPPRIAQIARQAAERLNNTPAIARKSYIHPAVIALAQDAQAVEALRAQALPRRSSWLSRAERGLIAYLHDAPPSAALLAA